MLPDQITKPATAWLRFAFRAVEKLRMKVDIRDYSKFRRGSVPVPDAGFPSFAYAAPNLTDTSFDTPGSCIVTP